MFRRGKVGKAKKRYPLTNVQTTRGDTEGNLQHHLKASRPLLSFVLSSSIYQGEVSTLEFIKEYYAHVSCITELTTGVDDDIPDISIDTSDFSPFASPMNAGVLLGCSYELFDLIP
jgi:hypothetical protein